MNDKCNMDFISTSPSHYTVLHNVPRLSVRLLRSSSSPVISFVPSPSTPSLRHILIIIIISWRQSFHLPCCPMTSQSSLSHHYVILSFPSLIHYVETSLSSLSHYAAASDSPPPHYLTVLFSHYLIRSHSLTFIISLFRPSLSISTIPQSFSKSPSLHESSYSSLFSSTHCIVSPHPPSSCPHNPHLLTTLIAPLTSV